MAHIEWESTLLYQQQLTAHYFLQFCKVIELLFLSGYSSHAAIGATKLVSKAIKGAARNPDIFLFTVCSVWEDKTWFFCLIPIVVLHYG